ncbi:MAG TPA: adenosylcobinamide amidohydrolase [Nitrospiraceae bacterium]|nr:adenosylcobinamide amidohydrolase [Nitrospiraceae bacterium]
MSKSFLTRFFLRNHTLLIDLGKRQRVLSSAPRCGGLVRARYILNHQVMADPIAVSLPASKCRCDDPARYLGHVAAQLAADRTCVALMTAVPLAQLVTLREELDGVWVEGFFTVGVSNAVRAGESTVTSDRRQTRPAFGTINIILVTNARLSSSALVGAVQVATESKTAVLLAKGIPSLTGSPGATGTGTDAVVIACGTGHVIRYSGTHTKIGELIGRLVCRGITEGLHRSKRWTHFTPR